MVPSAGICREPGHSALAAGFSVGHQLMPGDNPAYGAASSLKILMREGEQGVGLADFGFLAGLGF